MISRRLFVSLLVVEMVVGEGRVVLRRKVVGMMFEKVSKNAMNFAVVPLPCGRIVVVRHSSSPVSEIGEVWSSSI